MPFVKLDCGILNSTLWFEREAREVFITALLMAEPAEITRPMPQLEVSSLSETGWTVPPGWYGMVAAAGKGILHRARVEETVGLAALQWLGSPEQSSRSQDFEGRRLVRIDGGYLVLNFMKYRERDYTAAERAKRYREKKAKGNGERHTVSPLRHTVTSRKQKQKQSTEAEEERTATALPEERSKRPIFSGQRFTVFEWQLAQLERLLGSHYMSFDVHAWFFDLDRTAVATGQVVPQRDGGAWLLAQTESEAIRRGLPLSQAPDADEAKLAALVKKGPSVRPYERH